MVRPDNHFHLNQAFHFGMPLLSEQNERGDLPTNLDEAKTSNVPFSLSFTPVASNKQQLAENTKWLNQIPVTETATQTDNVVRLYQPITLKQNNQIIATMDKMLVEKKETQVGNGVNISLEAIYTPLKTKGQNTNTGPGHFVYAFNNLDATLVHALEKEIMDIKHLSKEKQMLMQLKMLTQLKALCKKDATLTVTYEENTLQGPTKEHYSIDLASLINSPMQFKAPMPIDLGAIFTGE